MEAGEASRALICLMLDASVGAWPLTRFSGRRREKLEHWTAVAPASAPGRGGPPYMVCRRRRLQQDGLDVLLLL